MPWRGGEKRKKLTPKKPGEGCPPGCPPPPPPPPKKPCSDEGTKFAIKIIKMHFHHHIIIKSPLI